MSVLLRTGFFGPIVGFLTPIDFLLIFLIFLFIIVRSTNTGYASSAVLVKINFILKLVVILIRLDITNLSFKFI